MPVLGTPPAEMGLDVIMTHGEDYVRAILISLSPQSASLKVPNECMSGAYRIFPLFPERDGLFELQGTLSSQEGDRISLDL